MPTPSRWAQAIRDAGFPVDLESDFDPDTATGFRPCQFRGILSGFEYYSGPLGEHERQEVGAPPGCDFSVSLVTHSDLREFATSLIAASVLCRVSDGVFYDPQEDERRTAAGILEWAHQQLALIEEHFD